MNLTGKDEILKAALELAKDVGVINLTRQAVCVKAGIADGSFPHIMGCTFTEFTKTLACETF